jgi:ribonucleoside-diphosphate reductase alpha chain
LGVLGWHSYLQKNRIPFEGMRAKQLTSLIFKDIRDKADKATQDLARIYGEAPLLKGYGRRNTTTLAIAPTTTSSAILGQTSPGIEPFSSNYYKAGLSKGNFMRKNKYLKEVLIEKGINNEDTWRSIMLHYGSVQHLTKLSADEKAVFKTFKEISQFEIIQQASIRQQYVDQSQSLNLNIPSNLPVKEVNKLIIEAWKLGIKTLYYQRSQSVSKELVTSLVDCKSCEG